MAISVKFNFTLLVCRLSLPIKLMKGFLYQRMEREIERFILTFFYHRKVINSINERNRNHLILLF